MTEYMGQAQQLLGQLSATKFQPGTGDANVIQLAIANALVGIGLALQTEWQGGQQQNQPGTFRS
jgi:hypothetical protein